MKVNFTFLFNDSLRISNIFLVVLIFPIASLSIVIYLILQIFLTTLTLSDISFNSPSIFNISF